MSFKFKDDNFWMDKLTSEQFQITRKGGTESPFTGKYLDNKDKGFYYSSYDKPKGSVLSSKTDQHKLFYQ